MIHKPIQLSHISFTIPHKICFDDFSVHIPYGSRIAIIGQNGSGKSSLLKILNQTLEPTNGDIKISEGVTIGYVPQVIETFDSLSGGERINQSLTVALRQNPNVLLLDEPSNHLDQKNRQSLIRMLGSFAGILIIVSHDLELLSSCIETLWHIDNGKIHIFSGNYHDYQRERQIKQAVIEQKLSRLKREKKEIHCSLMGEEKRAAKSRSKGEKSIDNRKWPTIVSNSKALRAEETSGLKKANISHKKQRLLDELSLLRLPETIIPQFSFTAADVKSRSLISISRGSIGYDPNHLILSHIYLTLGSQDRIAIVGNNGSGKSTLIKAILGDPAILKSGHWFMPKPEEIGYLDQHYGTLCADESVFETIQALVPDWSYTEIRNYLNHFLFREHEEVEALVKVLSGGEKARLTLAQIGCKTPKLLLLDEMTNNLDLETRAHVISVLKEYPGGLIVISHDVDFLQAMGISKGSTIEIGALS